MPIEYRDFICRADLHAERSALFIFGDNEERRGLGGLAAEMRGEPNAHGIRTKRAPHMRRDAFWSDEDFPRVLLMLREDFAKPYNWLSEGRKVVFSVNKIGTRTSELEVRAPKIFRYIMKKIELLEFISEEIRLEQLAVDRAIENKLDIDHRHTG